MILATCLALASGLLTVETARGIVGELTPEVERLRGLTFKKPVPVEVLGPEEARRHMMQRIEAFGQAEQMQWTGRAYALLHLLPEGYDLLEEMLGAVQEQAGGFYDPAQGTYYLMDRVPPAAAPIFTVHELTHALEDQHFDLDARLSEVLESEDGLLARSAVHEGSATLLMTVYTITAMLEGKLDRQGLEDLAAVQAESAQELARLPPVLLRQLLGPYLLGMSFLARGQRLDRDPGFPIASVNRAFEEGPVSSEQILHPEKFWDAEQRDDPCEVTLAGAGDLLGDSFERKSEGVLGELALGPLVGAGTPLESIQFGRFEGESWTHEAAAGWDGDRWELWVRGSEAIVLWASVWDSPEDARQFAAALPRGQGLAWKRRGDRVAVTAGATGKKARRALARMLVGSRPSR